MTSTALAARIAAAERGDRELSNAVLVACGWERHPTTRRPGGWLWRQPDWPPYSFRPDGHQPHPTCSETDVFGLVPAGYAVDLALCPEMGAACRIYRGPIRENSAGEPLAHAATPALALSAALVLAVAEPEDDDGMARAIRARSSCAP